MKITGEQIAEWRKQRGEGMVSGVGEYTPDAFWEALDEIEELRATLSDLLCQIEQVDGTAQLSIERAEKMLGISA